MCFFRDTLEKAMLLFIIFLFHLISTVRNSTSRRPQTLDLFLIKDPDFYKAFPSTRDRLNFIGNMTGRWDYRCEPNYPKIFSTYRPRGYNDFGDLNSKSLTYLYLCKEKSPSIAWSKYTNFNNLSPLDRFALECLKDSVFNVRVWATLCQIKKIPRSSLINYLLRIPRISSDLLNKYYQYDLFAKIANITFSIVTSLLVAILADYFYLIPRLAIYKDIFILTFISANILFGRLIYDNFLCL